MQDSLLQYFGESEISFDQFVIQTPSGQVLKDKQLVKLEPQVLTFLLLLIRHKDHIVSRDEIVAEVWAGKKASDDAIRALVKKLRIALGDNARAPKFLKTVPLKGYLFIMPVHIEFHQEDWWRSKYVIYGALIVAVILITLLVQSQFGSFESNEKKEKRDVTVSTITQMKGSEVSPHLSKNDRLLYSHRGPNDKSTHLYVKNLTSAVSKRLTWDTANYTDGIFSRDASQAIVKRREGDDETFVLFNFDPTGELLNAEAVVLDEALTLQRISAISYSHNGESLYLFGESKGKLNIAKENESIQSAQVNYGLIRYNIASKESVVLALPVPLGARVVDAKESDDGELLAVLIQSEAHADIHLVELESKITLFVKRIPSLTNSFVWAPDGESITFVTATSELLNLNLQRQRLYAWTGLPMAVSDVVSQCGEYCFVVKEKEADLVNIVERPFVFNPQQYMSATQFSLSSNDRFPTYFNNGEGIYFLSLTNDALSLQRHIDGQPLESIYELPKTSNIQSFSLSPNEKRFTGELDGRIVVYDVDMGTLTFISSGLQKHTNPVWVNNDSVLYKQQSDGASLLYLHDVSSNQFTTLAKGIALIKPLSDEQWLVVDDKFQAYILTTNDITTLTIDMLTADNKVADVDSINNANFVFDGNALYFLSDVDNTPMLNQIELSSRVLNRKALGLLSVLPQFDIHPNAQRMLVVESSLAQSNLIRVDGLTLATRQVNQVVTETP